MKITATDIARATLELMPALLLLAYFVFRFAGDNTAAYLAASALAAVIGFFLVFKIGVFILSRQSDESSDEAPERDSQVLN